MKKILIIDDVRSIRVLLKSNLEDLGYHVETAADGEEGWEKVLQTGPDLIITDLKMPKLDGLGLLARIRGDIRTHSIPVLCATSCDDGEVKKEAATQGATGWIQKPFHPDTWGAKLRQILNES